jgi:hypothetical protein
VAGVLYIVASPVAAFAFSGAMMCAALVALAATARR